MQPTQVLCRLTIVENVDQQTAAILDDTDIAAESGVRDGVPSRLHHDICAPCEPEVQIWLPALLGERVLRKHRRPK